MRLVKREKASGLILAVVDTEALTVPERVAISDELHQLIIECKYGEAAGITERGVEAQMQYLIAQRGEDVLTEAILDAIEAEDKWKSWK